MAMFKLAKASKVDSTMVARDTFAMVHGIKVPHGRCFRDLIVALKKKEKAEHVP